jgi:hypothetical protein
MKRSNRRIKRKAKKSYLLIVDGKTEIWYLQLMKKNENLKEVRIKPELPKNKKLEELYKMVEEGVKNFDKVIWILDLDVILKNNQVEIFKKYVNILQKNEKVIIFVNNPCMEFWYLLHYKDTNKFFRDCSEIIKYLKKYLKNYDKSEKYYKNRRQDIYAKLKPYQEKAIKNAKKLGSFDFENIESVKAEIYKIFNILMQYK